eukprot:TRINITY_DN8004_c0_g1_i1.p2 TRINITY_DN8004_c0_g1~~TRINITY_DN8004_c0_g1_i1.p2  ORF type:complete len:172 (+),score=67.34 TRINITY_DN8004_c0_g1_i1:128-643(+)
MPPKADEVKVLKFKVVGGEAPNAAQIAPKLSPLGINPKKIGDDIQKLTKEWKGIKIMVELSVQNREAKVTPLPTIAARVIKAMAEPVRDRKKQKIQKHGSSLSLEQIEEIATVVRDKSKAKDFKGVVKEILGTCQSVGGLVDGKTPKAISKMIDNGAVSYTHLTLPTSDLV